MNVIDIIQNNPYRILGVYVGSPVSLELSNKNKIAAFSRIGQHASFYFQIDEMLENIERTEALAEQAYQTLALPKDRLKNALFWIGDCKNPWSQELNNAIYALLEGKLLKAIYHYGNMFYDEALRTDFQHTVTQGLTNLSPEELTKILCTTLVDDEYEIISAFKQTDLTVKPNQIICQLCDQTIIRNLDRLLTFDDVITHITVSDMVEIDFYLSYKRLVSKIDELMPLVKVVGWVYGEDSPIYEEFVERIISDVYEKTTSIVDAIGKWSWVYDKKTMKYGERIKLISVRTKQCVDSCMHLISEINDFVNNVVDRLRPSQNSIRILLPVRYNYERVLNREYIIDESQIHQAVKFYKRSRLVSDIVWLAILGLIFFIV